MEATIEITEYEPPTTFTLQVRTEIETSQVKWVFEHVSGGGTKATLIWEQKLQDWRFKLVALIVLFVMRNKVASSPQYMQRLKSYLEDLC